MADKGISVIVKGSADVDFSNGCITAEDAEHTFKDNTLTITGAGSHGSVIFGSVGRNGSGICMSQVNRLTISSRGNRYDLTGPANAKIIFNGRELVPKDGNTGMTEPVPVKRVNYHLESDTYVRTLYITGSGDFRFANDSLKTNQDLDITIRGSGDVRFEKNICNHITCTIQGSGVISGSLNVKTAKLSIMGSGDIGNIHITEGVDASCMGSGDISVSALTSARVSKHNMGTGRISIKRKD